MPRNKAPLRVRLAARILGRDKAFIPHLSNTLDIFDASGNRIKDYRTKGEAITANLGWAYAANDAIARPMARVKLVLYKKDKKGNKIYGKVTDVWIAGERIVHGRRLATIDEPAVAARARAWQQRMN